MLDKIAIFLIRFYRNSLSYMMLHNCRFYPSCSHYSEEAIEKQGLLRAFPKIIYRILRCQPLGKGGYDPVN
jgi:putative membrane protein insertion efficiency factor